MAAKDLITTARAKQDIQATTDSSQDTLIATLITACSDGIEKYCRRDFNVKSYDELYYADGERSHPRHSPYRPGRVHVHLPSPLGLRRPQFAKVQIVRPARLEARIG